MATIEEKAKAYDKAIKKAKKDLQVCEQDCLVTKQIFRYFPELAMSKDEKIRKELIEHVKDQQSSFISAPDCRDKYEEEENNKYNSWLAWLEKQGEQKPTIKYVYPKFRIGDVIVPIKPNGSFVPVRVKAISDGSYYCAADKNNAFLSLPIREENEYRLAEQKHTEWSEEDDTMIEETLYFLREYQQSNRCKDENGMQNSVTYEKWLKSLKDRVHPQNQTV